MTRTTATLLVACLLLALFAWQAQSQPQQGFGPTYDPANQALRVNIVSGGGSGGTASNFGTVFPSVGTAIGGKDPNGAMASFTISNTGRLQVTCDNCSSSAASFGTAFPGSGGPGGYKDASGAFASFTGQNGKQNVIVGNESTLVATVSSITNPVPLASSSWVNVAKFGNDPVVTGTGASGAGIPRFTMSNDSVLSSITNSVTVTGTVTANQGASASTTNLWPVGITSSGDSLVRPGDPVNNAMRVNIVAGGVSGATFGTAFPSTGSPAGYKDTSGAFASFTGANGKQNVIVGNESTISATLNASNAIIGNVRTTSDSTLSATLSTGNNIVGNIRTTSDSTLTATVTQSTAANLNALVAAGASASVANTWSTNVLSDTGDPVRPGDTTNKAVRVNVVAGGTTNSTFGAGFPTTGIAGGYRDASGAFASLTGANGAANATLRDSAGRELGSTLPGQQTVPVAVQQAPTLPPQNQVTLGQRITALINVIVGQAPATPVKTAVATGGVGSGGGMYPHRACDRNASISASNVGFTQLVSAGAAISVCGYTVVAGTTPVGIAFGYGTGTNCGTASTDLTGSMTVVASGGMVNTPTSVGVFDVPAGQALCIKLSNGASVGGHLRYAQ